MLPSTSRPCHLKDVVLVGHQICDHEAELRGGQEVGHLVVVGVARQPRLDDELVGALSARHEPVPGHLHARQGHLQTRVWSRAANGSSRSSQCLEKAPTRTLSLLKAIY